MIPTRRKQVTKKLLRSLAFSEDRDNASSATDMDELSSKERIEELERKRMSEKPEKKPTEEASPYNDQAQGVIDLPTTLQAVQDAIMPYLVELLFPYVDEVVEICREYGLYLALVYLFNRGLDGFRSPLEELLVASGWKIAASFEGNFPNHIKQLPLDRHFEVDNVKRVHRVLLDIVSSAANATPGLGRYPPFKREVVAIATASLDTFNNEAKKMVAALVDMEHAFVPPQQFSLDWSRGVPSPSCCLADALKLPEQATSPQTGGQQSGGSLKSMKEKTNQQGKDGHKGSILKTAGPDGEMTAGLR
ncbi:hypothetical protein NL676_039871 [Syzygium grande]|nr:hypothetical protein NL676_039871 [Syzygium grande]